MKNIACLFIVALTACGGGSSNSAPPVTPPVTPPASNPPKPAIASTQVDRMGRPAVNTALTNPFGLVSGKTTAQSEDEYNANANPSTWATSFSAEIAANLAVFDGLDGTCGNQLAAGTTANATRYSALAGVIADDRLYVRTDKTTCALYLAAEADAVGLTTNNGDCGGRTPLEDTIKETYSLLVIGRPTGVTDGLPTNGTTGLGSEEDGFPSTTTFPFLNTAH